MGYARGVSLGTGPALDTAVISHGSPQSAGNSTTTTVPLTEAPTSVHVPEPFRSTHSSAPLWHGSGHDTQGFASLRWQGGSGKLTASNVPTKMERLVATAAAGQNADMSAGAGGGVGGRVRPLAATAAAAAPPAASSPQDDVMSAVAMTIRGAVKADGAPPAELPAAGYVSNIIGRFEGRKGPT